MRRIHLFEFLDQSWCPQAVRDGATDCLEAITSTADVYRTVRPIFLDAIQACEATHVVDLCSGGGGPWFSKQWLHVVASMRLRVALTDKFPSHALALRTRGHDGLRAIEDSVDATAVPSNLSGFRTIFSSLHHFPDKVAKCILQDAVAKRSGFASAEVTSRSFRAALTICFLPIAVWLLTPKMRPFRWSRLMLTYLLPAIPFVILWDGLVSCLRTRTPEELLELTRGFPQYDWKAGYSQGSWLAPVYLIGVPSSAQNDGSTGIVRSGSSIQDGQIMRTAN
jgi:hypothetical protein